MSIFDIVDKKRLMDIFNNVNAAAKSSDISINVYKDKDGFYVGQIQEIFTPTQNMAAVSGSLVDDVIRAANNLDLSLAAKGGVAPKVAEAK